MEIIACPQPGCDLAAEVLDRILLESTDRPVEHLRLACLGGHRFLMPCPTDPGQPAATGRSAGRPRQRRRVGSP